MADLTWQAARGRAEAVLAGAFAYLTLAPVAGCFADYGGLSWIRR